jgi:hypothetical protein
MNNSNIDIPLIRPIGYNNNIINNNNKPYTNRPNITPITLTTTTKPNIPPITHNNTTITPVSKDYFDVTINKLNEKFDTIINTMDRRYINDLQAVEDRYLEAINSFQSQHSLDLQNLNASFTDLYNQYSTLLEQHNILLQNYNTLIKQDDTLIEQQDNILSILQPPVIVPSSYTIPTTGPTLISRDDIDASFTPDVLKQPIASLSKNISTYTKEYNVHDHPVKMANLEIMKQNYDLLRTIRDERKAIIDGRIKDKIKPRI